MLSSRQRLAIQVLSGLIFSLSLAMIVWYSYSASRQKSTSAQVAVVSPVTAPPACFVGSTKVICVAESDPSSATGIKTAELAAINEKAKRNILACGIHQPMSGLEVWLGNVNRADIEKQRHRLDQILAWTNTLAKGDIQDAYRHQLNGLYFDLAGADDELKNHTIHNEQVKYRAEMKRAGEVKIPAPPCAPEIPAGLYVESKTKNKLVWEVEGPQK